MIELTHTCVNMLRLQFPICTKIMESFELCLKEKATTFHLNCLLIRSEDIAGT